MIATASKPGSAPLLSRRYALDAIPRGGLTGRIEADAGERAAIATALGLQALAGFAFDFALKPLPRARFRLTGRVEAIATQSCVVTLDPVEATVAEDVVQEFWPAESVEGPEPRTGGTEVEVMLEGPEPHDGQSLDLGQIAYEVLATALDPYPRRPGAEFDWADRDAASGGGSPFAALKSLKKG